MLLHAVIKNRLEGAEEEDEDCELWEPREIIKLPFSCHRACTTSMERRLSRISFEKTKMGMLGDTSGSLQATWNKKKPAPG
jgi:hypothetical protein